MICVLAVPDPSPVVKDFIISLTKLPVKIKWDFIVLSSFCDTETTYCDVTSSLKYFYLSDFCCSSLETCEELLFGTIFPICIPPALTKFIFQYVSEYQSWHSLLALFRLVIQEHILHQPLSYLCLPKYQSPIKCLSRFQSLVPNSTCLEIENLIREWFSYRQKINCILLPLTKHFTRQLLHEQFFDNNKIPNLSSFSCSDMKKLIAQCIESLQQYPLYGQEWILQLQDFNNQLLLSVPSSSSLELSSSRFEYLAQLQAQSSSSNVIVEKIANWFHHLFQPMSSFPLHEIFCLNGKTIIPIMQQFGSSFFIHSHPSMLWVCNKLKESPKKKVKRSLLYKEYEKYQNNDNDLSLDQVLEELCMSGHISETFQFVTLLITT